jgi:hypothetical protein
MASVGRMVVTEENRRTRNETCRECVDPFIVSFVRRLILLAPINHYLLLSNGREHT